MAELRVVPGQGGLAFYIDGSLQFDTLDEAVYHETLALPALGLAEARARGALGALALGGGDGLALRELLKSPRVSAATLVDFDPAVLELGRGAFAPYNRNAFADPRARAVCAEAAGFLRGAGEKYDLVLADFTFPDDLAGCSLFTESFFRLAASALKRRGLFAMNAVSPDRFPAAYWSIYRTLRAAGLFPKPLAAEIPSFSAHGYGRWGFFLASPRAITPGELARLDFRGRAEWLNPERLQAGMRFGRDGAALGLGLASVITRPAELMALLNLPARAAAGGGELDFFLRANRELPQFGFPADPALWGAETLAAWEERLAAALAGFDWEKLLAETAAVSAELGESLRADLDELKAALTPQGAGGDRQLRLFRTLAALAALLILVNMAYPDNAFAKGYSSGGGGDMDFTFFANTPPTPFHTSALQMPAFIRGLAPDSAGRVFPVAELVYRRPGGEEKKETPFYSLSDTLRVTRDGAVFASLPAKKYYLAVEAGAFALLKEGSPEPLFRFKPDAELTESYNSNLRLQYDALGRAIKANEKWLSWAAPAGAVLPPIRGESNELAHMREIKAALDKLGALPSPGPDAPPPGFVKLCPGVYAGAERGEIVFLRDDGDLAAFPMPGLPVYADAVALPHSAELEEFVRQVLWARFTALPVGSPARLLVVEGSSNANGNTVPFPQL